MRSQQRLPLADPPTPVTATPTGRAHGGPFAGAAPTLRVAAVYALATVVWATLGDRLPGGRWFAVHLWTLGVLTNLVLVFSEHFGRVLTRARDDLRPVAAWELPVANAGVLAVLAGIPSGNRIALASGATAVTTVVLVAWHRLRTLRRAAVGTRFPWIVRAYERAHGAFVHGAVLGALLGAGALADGWYAAARTAHLHVTVLGWGGLTLLGTLVFFGPTLARTRIEDGAEARAAVALRHGATALTVGVLLLLVSGIGGTVGTAARVAAAAALAGFATAVTVVCRPVARAALAGVSTGARPSIVAASLWFPAVVWADVAVVATGRWALLDALGVAVVAGVLLPAVVATLTHLAPMLRGRNVTARTRTGEVLARGAQARVVVAQAAAVTLVVCAAFGSTLGPGGAWMQWAAWLALVGATLTPVLVAWSTPRD